MSEEKKPTDEKAALEPWTFREWMRHIYAGFQRGSVYVVIVAMVSGILWFCWGWVFQGVRNGTAAAMYIEQATAGDNPWLPKPDPQTRKRPPKPSSSPTASPSPSPMPSPSASPSPPAKK